MTSTENDIVRYSGDTYPNKSIIKIGGVPVDIDGWEVQVRYREPGSDIIRIVDCVITDPHKGRLSIYPHSRPSTPPTPVAWQNQNMDYKLEPGMFVSDEMDMNNLHALLKDPNVDMAGEDETSDKNTRTSNQCWDDGAKEYDFSIVRVKRFGNYEEVMTHNTGKIRILDRV